MKTYFAASDIHSFHWEWMQALSNAGFNLKSSQRNGEYYSDGNTQPRRSKQDV